MGKGNRRTQAQRRNDYERIVHYLNIGYTYEQIADALGKTKAIVWRDIVQIKQQWAASRETYYESMDRELSDINRQLEELWAAWELSKLPQREIVVEEITNHRDVVNNSTPARIQRATERNREGLGDMAIMSQITKLREQRMRLLGLLHGNQTEININNAGDTGDIRVSRATALALQAAIDAVREDARPSGDNESASQAIIVQEPVG